MKHSFFIILWSALIINIALYWYRSWIVKQRKEGKFLKAGVYVHKVVINGPKNWLWLGHFFEDFLLKAFFPIAAWLILKDFEYRFFFVIPLAVPLLLGFFKLGIVLEYYLPFFWPLFFGGWKGKWTFYCFTFNLPRLIVLFILGCLAGAALIEGSIEIFSTEPEILSKPTIDSLRTVPEWIAYAVGIPFVIVMFLNIFYLLWKINPILSRFYVEYNDEVLRLISRITKRELMRVNFRQLYSCEKAYDQRSSGFSGSGEVLGYIFAQGNKAIALTETMVGLSGYDSSDDNTFNRPSNRAMPYIWDADLPGKVSVTYVVTPEECGKVFGEIVNNHKLTKKLKKKE